MRNKIEIKVYLPYTMVGELEREKRRGNRSKYIEGAIRAKFPSHDRVGEPGHQGIWT